MNTKTDEKERMLVLGTAICGALFIFGLVGALGGWGYLKAHSDTHYYHYYVQAYSDGSMPLHSGDSGFFGKPEDAFSVKLERGFRDLLSPED